MDVRCLATKLLSDVLKKLSNTGSLLTEDGQFYLCNNRTPSTVVFILYFVQFITLFNFTVIG